MDAEIKNRAPLKETTGPLRTVRYRWRDELAADYELMRARLDVGLEFDDGAEEYL